MEKPMFFIGICPPSLLEKRIHGIKQELYQKYEVKGAFRSMAHITLQMPFNLSTKKIGLLISELQNVGNEQANFQIELKDFGCFEPRVVFVNVNENSRLRLLQKSVEKVMKNFQVFNSTHKNRGFNPHITVAFRDVKKVNFYKIWDELKERRFEDAFLADSITVFKHNGSSWDIYAEIQIGQ